jgi:death-on-curing protein
VLDIHADVANVGLRDVERLESAIGAAETFFIYSESADVFHIGAAYAYYISESQPFLDGNKRTALAVCLDFLKINGYPTAHYDNVSLFKNMVAMGDHRMERDEFASFLRNSSL